MYQAIAVASSHIPSDQPREPGPPTEQAIDRGDVPVPMRVSTPFHCASHHSRGHSATIDALTKFNRPAMVRRPIPRKPRKRVEHDVVSFRNWLRTSPATAQDRPRLHTLYHDINMLAHASVAYALDDAVAARAAAKVARALQALPAGFNSVSRAAKEVLKEAAQVAVVAIESSSSGTNHEVYDLVLACGFRIVMEHLEVTPEATTRFVALAKHHGQTAAASADVSAKADTIKTSLILSFPADDGSKSRMLHRVMGVLVVHGVELVKIESRRCRQPDADDEYLLYVDVAGSESDANVAAALTGLRELTHFVLPVGSYYAATEDEDPFDTMTVLPPQPVAALPVTTSQLTMTDKYPLNPLVANAPLGRNLVIVAKAKQMASEGQKVAALCIGETDFLPPARAIDAAVRALQHGNVKYAHLRGDPTLRTVIAKYFTAVKGVTYDPETEIQVTAGAQQALYHALYSLIRPGDKVILPSPYWGAYEAIVKQVRAGLVQLPGKPEEDYLINPKALEAALHANPETKVLMLCNPSNPAGTLHTPEHLERIAAVLRKPQFRHVVVVADEIYEQVVYQDEGQPQRVHQCFASLPDMFERTIIVNGFSKAYAMTGLRIGFVAAPRHFVDPCLTLQGHFTSSACTVGQIAAAEALREELELFEQGQSRIAPVLSGLNDKRQFLVKRLQAIPKLHFAYPTAAFYIFMDLSAYFDGKRAFSTDVMTDSNKSVVIADVADFCEYVLREYRVALSPGIDFGHEFGVRLSYAAPMEALARGVDALEHALGSLLFEEL